MNGVDCNFDIIAPPIASCGHSNGLDLGTMPLQRHAALLGRVACSDMRLWIAESGVLDGGARSASGAKTITQQHVSRWYSSATRVLGMPVVDVPVPSMGESITEGSVAAVLKQPGQAVAADDIILQIETDKVTIDVRAPQQGVMTSILVCGWMGCNRMG